MDCLSLKVKISLSATQAKFTGSTQTIQCSRDGDVRWTKVVYVPLEDEDAFYSKYLHTSSPPFSYTVIGKTTFVRRRPSGMPLWTNF